MENLDESWGVLGAQCTSVPDITITDHRNFLHPKHWLFQNKQLEKIKPNTISI